MDDDFEKDVLIMGFGRDKGRRLFLRYWLNWMFHERADKARLLEGQVVPMMPAEDQKIVAFILTEIREAMTMEDD